MRSIDGSDGRDMCTCHKFGEKSNVHSLIAADLNKTDSTLTVSYNMPLLDVSRFVIEEKGSALSFSRDRYLGLVIVITVVDWGLAPTTSVIAGLAGKCLVIRLTLNCSRI